VTYVGACSLNVSVRRREFPSAPCFAEKKLDDSSHLHIAEIALVA